MEKLKYQIVGKGRPIIILHGLFGSAKNWHSIARTLASSYQIISVDLRNHGDSFHHASMSYAEMADDLATLCRYLNVNDGVFIGHSMGGKVAMNFALNYPELLSALIVVDIAPVSYDHNFYPLLETMLNLNLDKIKKRTDAEIEFKQVTKDKNTTRFILQNLIWQQNKYQWRINLEAIYNNLPSIIGFPDKFKVLSCQIPSLFLAGAESGYVRSRHIPAIHHYFPTAKVTPIDNADHWLHIEQPTAFLDQVNQFINQV